MIIELVGIWGDYKKIDIINIKEERKMWLMILRSYIRFFYIYGFGFKYCFFVI